MNNRMTLRQRRAAALDQRVTEYLADGPDGVYEMWRHLRVRSARLFASLTRLETAGVVTSELVGQSDGTPDRRFYRLTGQDQNQKQDET